MADKRNFRKYLSEQFESAVFAVGLLIQEGVPLAVGELSFLLNATPEQKAERKARKEEAAAQQRALAKAVIDNIVRHPAAQDAGVLTDLSAQVKVPVHVLAHGALHSVSCVISEIWMEDGFRETPITLKKEDDRIINEINCHLAIEHDEAKELWHWVHALAASGEAPHLFPGMKVSPLQDGDLSVTGDDYPKKNAYVLWKADRNAAVARRATPPRKQTPPRT